MSDLIDRRAAIDAVLGRTTYKTKHELMLRINTSIADENGWLGGIAESLDEIEDLPSVQPYTDEEIQAMQDLEQAQLDKAYELGWKEGREALRREIWEDERERLD